MTSPRCAFFALSQGGILIRSDRPKDAFRMSRSFLLCVFIFSLAVTGLHAEDKPLSEGDGGEKPDTALMAMLVSILAGAETSFNPAPGGESYAKGGPEGPASVGYEKVRLVGDTLRFWQTPLPGVKRMVLSHCRLLSGPYGQEPQRVILDSRASELPQMVFRGLFKPGEVEITRLALDAKDPRVVRFQIELRKTGDFYGKLHTDKGWMEYGGWAETVVMMLRATIDPTRQDLTDYRFESICLYGRPRQGEQAKERALIMRLKNPLSEHVPAISVPRSDSFAGCTSMLITIFFKPDGSIGNAQYGPWTEVWNPNELFGTAQIAEPSAPAVISEKGAKGLRGEGTEGEDLAD